jgi:hypothetical protein
VKNVTTFGVSRRVALGVVLVCATPAMLAAQTRAPESPTPPKTLSEPRGFVSEPDVIERAAIFSDRRLGNDEFSSGWRVGFADLAPGAGWLSAQTTYRRWGANDRHVAEASAGFSIHGYSALAARFEYLALADGRVSAGAAFRRQDYTQVPYFGSGPQTREVDVSQYRLQSSNLVGYVRVRPARYLDLDLSIGVLNPDVHRAAGPGRRDRPDTRDRYAADPLFALTDQPSFVTSAVALTSDSRDFPGRSLRGGIVHLAATRYSDRIGETASFRRYEAEVARFIPFASERVVLAVHGRLVGSDTGDGQFVPFYLQPTLGGQRSLRSYENYRFHDRNLASLTVETRIALMTHVDTAFFVDAGNVAPRAGDLNLERRSYGAGLRLHTRRHTFARVDVAHGSDGWRAMLTLDDPLVLARLKRRTALVPVVP